MMDSNSRVPELKGRPFFEQLRLAINFIDSNMKLIDNSVKTSSTDEEYRYVQNVLGKVDKLNEDVNAVARCVKTNNVLRKQSASEFEDEVQNLKEMLRCKEIEYGLEPFKYPTTTDPVVRNNVQASGALNGAKQAIQQVQSSGHQLGNQPGHQLSQLPERKLKFLNRNGQYGKGVLNHLNSASKNSAKKNVNFHTDTFNLDGQSLKNRADANGLVGSRMASHTQTINLTSLHSNFASHPNQLSSKNKCSSIKKQETFLFRDGAGPAAGGQIKKPELRANACVRKDQPKEQPKESQADLTSESIDPNNQFSFDFKLPYNKLKNNYFPSSSNFSVDESLEIEFTPGLKSRRTCKKPQTLNESNASTQDLQTFDKQGLQFDNRDNSIRSDLSLPARPEVPAKPEPLADKQTAHAKPDGYVKREDLLRSNACDKENRQQEFTKPDPVKSEAALGSECESPAKNADKFQEIRFDLKAKSQKLATPKKPPNFDFLNF